MRSAEPPIVNPVALVEFDATTQLNSDVEELPKNCTVFDAAVLSPRMHAGSPVRIVAVERDFTVIGVFPNTIALRNGGRFSVSITSTAWTF